MNCNKCENLGHIDLIILSHQIFICDKYKQVLTWIPYNNNTKWKIKIKIEPLDKCNKLRKEKLEKIRKIK
jgi:hypothetical protein